VKVNQLKTGFTALLAVATEVWSLLVPMTRTFGVRSAMPIKMALRLCPQAKVNERRYGIVF
jgi:nucleotidyltransferase/DNA polymerase involved in DNA repair